MKIKCVIVDDEPIARQILEKYCSLLSEIEVVASCSSALQAKRVVESKAIDLVFADINMPVLDGLSFVKTLIHPPLVIFSTAYAEYAHIAFDLSACDYLLKPFSFDRFVIAVDKAKQRLAARPNIKEELAIEGFTFFKSEGKIYKINMEDICFAEASGNYVKVVTEKESIKLAFTFTAFEEMLPKPQFVRLHRSFIVNKNKLRYIEGNRVQVGSAEIPIGANYKEHFFRELGIK